MKSKRVGLRLLFGLAAIAAFGFLAAPDFVSVTSNNAVVSARMVTLRAPIAGRVSGLTAQAGEAVEANQVLARVENTRADRQKLHDLQAQLTRLDGEIAAGLRLQDSLFLKRLELRDRLTVHKSAQIAWAEARLAETTAKAAALAADTRLAQADQKRFAALSTLGHVSKARLDSANADAERARFTERAAQQEITQAKADLAAAQDGRMIGLTNNNDIPYSAQKIDELDVRLAETEAEHRRLIAARAETENRLRTEQNRVDLLASADVTAPVDGALWVAYAVNGNTLVANDVVADMVDCRTPFVIASIPQSDFPHVDIGDTAVISLLGDSGVTFEGKVLQKRAVATAREADRLAAVPEVLDTRGYVFVSHPPTKKDENCPVGRSAHVRFTNENTGLWPRFIHFFKSLAANQSNDPAAVDARPL